MFADLRNFELFLHYFTNYSPKFQKIERKSHFPISFLHYNFRCSFHCQKLEHHAPYVSSRRIEDTTSPPPLLLHELFHYAVHIFVTKLIGNLPHDIRKGAKQQKKNRDTIFVIVRRIQLTHSCIFGLDAAACVVIKCRELKTACALKPKGEWTRTLVSFSSWFQNVFAHSNVHFYSELFRKSGRFKRLHSPTERLHPCLHSAQDCVAGKTWLIFFI